MLFIQQVLIASMIIIFVPLIILCALSPLIVDKKCLQRNSP